MITFFLWHEIAFKCFHFLGMLFEEFHVSFYISIIVPAAVQTFGDSEDNLNKKPSFNNKRFIKNRNKSISLTILCVACKVTDGHTFV